MTETGRSTQSAGSARATRTVYRSFNWVGERQHSPTGRLNGRNMLDEVGGGFPPSGARHSSGRSRNVCN